MFTPGDLFVDIIFLYLTEPFAISGEPLWNAAGFAAHISCSRIVHLHFVVYLYWRTRHVCLHAVSFLLSFSNLGMEVRNATHVSCESCSVPAEEEPPESLRRNSLLRGIRLHNAGGAEEYKHSLVSCTASLYQPTDSVYDKRKRTFCPFLQSYSTC